VTSGFKLQVAGTAVFSPDVYRLAREVNPAGFNAADYLWKRGRLSRRWQPKFKHNCVYLDD
jgi:hypothetical protein